MKRGLFTLGFLVLAAALAAPPVQARDVSVRAEVRMAPLSRHHGAPPPLGRKQGWLTISNRDWQPYSLVVERKDRLFLYRANEGRGGIMIPSGATITIALEKETYDLYGSRSDKLKVKIREGRTTTLALEPFGYVGSTGLRGIVNDGDKVRDEVLFDGYVHTVVVPQPAPPVVIAPPPPPPVIVRPPVVVSPGRPGHHRPPPPPPSRPGHGRPSHGGKNDGWGFVFGFGKK